MNYTCLGKSGREISVIGFGGWAMGGHGYGKVEDSESIAAIHKALDLGVTIFDTADVYGFGHSEEVLSKALGPRIQDVVVSTKFGVRWDDSGRTYKDCGVGYLRKALEGSLRRLKTDCIPLYQLHWHDGVTPLSHIFEALFRLREEGKIRYVGCSNIPSSVFCEALGSENVVAAQVHFSIAFRRTAEDLSVYHERYRMATLVYGVLGRGFLSGRYARDSRFGERDTRGIDPDFRMNLDRNMLVVEGIKNISGKYRKSPSQVAIRWALDNAAVSCALVGIKTVEQVSDNVGAVGWRLEQEDRDYLDALGGANEAGP